LPETTFTAFDLHAEPIEYRDGMLLAELTAENSDRRETAHPIAARHAYIDEVVRMGLGRRKAFLEK
jgi:hypothetical protein